MTILLLILLFSFSVVGQMDFWPEELSAPIVEESVDSNAVDIILEQDLEKNIYQTNNSISLLKSDSIKHFKQLFSYDLSDDNSLDIQNNYIDFSGAISRKKFPFQFSSLGLEWIPTAVFNRRLDDKYGNGMSNGIGSMRIGPTIGINYYNLPMHLSGGAAVDLWNGELPNTPGWQDLGEAKGDPGLYGALTVGNNRRQLVEGIPFYAEGSIFGKYMSSADNSKITNGEINALFFRDVAFADTLFLYCADTLSKGRTAFLSDQRGGSAKYIRTPNRTNNSLQASLGIKNIGKWFLKPSLFYRWTLSSLTYPAHEDILGDQRIISHTIACIGQNEAGRIVNYSGGISFSFIDDNWMFRNKFPLVVTDDMIFSDSLLLDSLNKNLKDNDGFLARMYHTIGKQFKNSFGFLYSFDISRYRETYPSFYIDKDNDTSHSDYDKDNVKLQHSLTLTLFSTPRLTMTTLTEYSRNEIVYLRKEMSATNKTERVYRIETSLHTTTDSAKSDKKISETIGVFVKNEEDHFPEFQGDGPPWLRKLYSKFEGMIGIGKKASLECLWNETYTDDGYWHTLEDYYAIETFSLETRVELAALYRFPNNFIVRAGNLLEYIYYWDYNYYEKKYTNTSYLFYLMPFVEIQAFLFKRVYLQARIERYIDPVADDFWEAKSTINLVF